MTDQLHEIGARLAALRDFCDTSAEEMAAQLKLPLEDYLAYENGEKDFSFSFLYNASSILGVDILDLMSGETPKLSMCSVVRSGQGYSIKKEDAYDYKHLAYTFRSKKAEPFLVTVEPNDEEPHMHNHEGQEFNYVVSGKMMFYIGEFEHELHEGDSVYFDSNIPHAEKALGDDEEKFIAVAIR